MSVDRPKLRSDLVVSRQESAGGPVCVIKEPVAGSFFRLGELEGFIVDQCDGATPAEDIRRRTEARFAAPLPDRALHDFLNRLQSAGLLESATPSPHAGRVHSPRIRGSLLSLRFRICNPDRLFDWLVTRVRFPYSKPALVVSALSILVAVAVFLSNWAEVRAEFFRVYRLTTIPLLLLTLFAMVSAHELAHGLTCKRFGGRVPELGFMWMYFQPALYCNVSDAWLFPDKARRLWVGAAGPFFELFLWSAATLAWRVSEDGTWIHHVAYLAMTSSGLKTLLNFNPLIRLDGYYLLSDWLEIPNLRSRAFRHLGDAIRKPDPRARRAAPKTRRERRILLLYGLGATLYSLAFLSVVAATLAGYLVEHGQPIGIALLGGLLGARTRRRFRGWFHTSSGTSPWDEDPDPPVAPGEGDGAEPAERPPHKAHRRAGKRRTARHRWARRLAVAGAVAGAVFLGRLELSVHGPFRVLPIHNADVRAEVEGLVETVHVREGDRVEKGDVIARLSDRDLRLELQKVEAGIERSEAGRRMLESGPTAEEVAVARAAVRKAERQLALARERLAMDQAIFDKQLLSRKDLIGSQDQAAMAESDLAEARSRLDLLLRGARPEEIAAITAEIKGLESQRRFLEEQLRLLTVVSPVPGVVATPAAQLEGLVHRLVRKGDLIAKVYESRTLTAEIEVSERDIADVRAGSTVLLKARSHPERTFRGSVVAIGTTAAGVTDPGGDGGARRPSTILVRTEIDNHARVLKPGMTGHAKIQGGRKPIAHLLGRWLSHTIRVEFWSWW